MADFEEIQRKADEEQRRKERLQKLINESMGRMRQCTSAPNTLESMNNPSSCSSVYAERNIISPREATYIEQIHVLQKENQMLLDHVTFLRKRVAFLEGLKQTPVVEKEKKPKTEVVDKIKTGTNKIYQDFIKWINT